MRNATWFWLPVAAISTSVYAKTFLSVEQAQQAIFPGARPVPSFITLTEAQKKDIERRTNVSVRFPEVRLWRIEGGGYFIVDEVIGKHELITYAIGLNVDGSVKRIEIMDYRENYGSQVRYPQWRDQFVGKTATAPLEIENDIVNITGATLSCRHITEGVKRVLATYEIAFK